MIDSVIISIILKNSRVTIPGFGTFVHNEEGHLIFLSMLKSDDNFLTKAVSAAVFINENEASEVVKAFSANINEIMETKGVYHLDDFGDFTKDKNGLISFVQSTNFVTKKVVEFVAEKSVETIVITDVVEEKEVVEAPAKVAEITSVEIDIESDPEVVVVEAITEHCVCVNDVVDEKQPKIEPQESKTLAEVISEEAHVKRVFEAVHPKIQNDNYEAPQTLHSKLTKEEEPCVAADVVEKPQIVEVVATPAPAPAIVEAAANAEIANVINDMLAVKERKSKLTDLYGSEPMPTKPESVNTPIYSEVKAAVGKNKEVPQSATINNEVVRKKSTDYVMIIAITAISLAVLVSAYYFFVRVGL